MQRSGNASEKMLRQTEDFGAQRTELGKNNEQHSYEEIHDIYEGKKCTN